MNPETFFAWLLLAALVVVPPVLALATRRRSRCECGAFKLPRAEQCFDCTIAEQPDRLI